MEIQVYLIYFSLFLTVRGLRLPSTKPIPDHDDLKRNDVTAAASDAESVRPIKFDDSNLRPVLASNSPFFHHAKHQNSGFRNRPAAPVPVSFLLGRTASARSAQFLASDPDSCSATISCDKTSTVQYRTFDGSCNNEDNPEWGKANTPYRRIAQRKHTLVHCGNPSFLDMPNSRLVSRVMVKRTITDEPDASNDTTVMLMTFGQVVDHDMQLTPLRDTESGQFMDCCAPANKDHVDCCPIEVPEGDLFFGIENRPDCLPFLRSKLFEHQGNSCRKLADVGNANTAYLDLSFLYGSDEETALNIRSTDEGQGLLKIQVDSRGRHYPHISPDGVMVFADARGDVHAGFTLLHSIFLRNHNRLAKELRQQNPDWNDENLYQEARKINGALLQHITYTQYLDTLLGKGNNVTVPLNEGHENYYDKTADASVMMIFSTAAFRLHTQVSGSFQLKDENHTVVATAPLKELFHRPHTLLVDNTYDQLLRGQSSQSVQDFNNVYTEQMTEWLFANKDFGLDIVSLNVQRGRDHQIQGYTTYKYMCGLGSNYIWEDLKDLIPEELVHRLSHAYQNPGDLDMYIAQVMETVLPGTQLGPTAHCLIKLQFEMTKRGDRFFYTNPDQFTIKQLEEIKKQSLTSLLCVNSDEPVKMNLQPNVFRKLDSTTNALKSCSEYPNLDLSMWSGFEAPDA